MKEITLDIPVEAISRRLFREKTRRAEVVDYVRPLHMDRGNLTSLVRLRFAKGPARSPKSLLGFNGLTRVEVISQREDGTYTCLMTTKPSGKLARLLEGFGKTFFVKEAPTLRGGLVRLTLVGMEKGLRGFTAKLNRYGVRFTVGRIRAVDAAASDPLAALTARQSEALTLAHELGYFRRPKETSSDTLAKLLDIDKSTFLEHLRKAENRLLDSLLASGAASESPRDR